MTNAISSQTPQTEAEKVGLAAAVKAAFSAIDKSDLSFAEKRNLLFSVYSFRCLFDNAEMLRIDPVLLKYGCTGFCAVSRHPSYIGRETEFDRFIASGSPYIPYGGILVKHEGGTVVRFDAGSPVWQAFIQDGGAFLDKKMRTVPEKLELYDMVYELINLSSATESLRALWYIAFPFAMLLDAPHDADLYEAIYDNLARESVLKAVLDTPYSLYIQDSAAALESMEIPRPIIRFYLPFLEYKNQTDENGVSNDEKRYGKWLSKGRFTDVFVGTEKALDADPFNDQILLYNIAARISLEGAADENQKRGLLKETLALIESALERGSEKRVLLHYYAALAHLGLQNRDASVANLILCNELDPGFNPSKILLTAMENRRQ